MTAETDGSSVLGQGLVIVDACATVKVKELILVAVEAMHCLGEGNETTQSAMISAGHFDPIIKVLTQTRYQSVQVRLYAHSEEPLLICSAG